MSLKVYVKSASNLPNVDSDGMSDPYVIITLKEQRKKTKVVKNSLNPKWDEMLEWRLEMSLNGTEILNVQVNDHEKIYRNRKIGSTEISLYEVVYNGRHNVTATLELLPKWKKIEQNEPKIVLEITYEAPPRVNDDGRSLQQECVDVPNIENMQISGNGYDIENLRMKNPLYYKKHCTSLSNKPTNFQVRLHLLQARKLVGSGLNPIVKVVCGTDIEQTCSQKGTNNPNFNEVLFFNFCCRPEIMLDKLVLIKVLNAKKGIRDPLIGSFSFDLRMVYNEPDHSFIHKWLLLTDPKKIAAGTKGYLKFSIQVISPGDNPKYFPPEMSQEIVDIESNLLRPLGVRLIPATLSIRIFQGEDLPQMDPGYFEKFKKILHIGRNDPKELVDPYCIVSFAGHKGKTGVIWNTQDPKWKQQINLGVRFPTMSERIRFQLKDKDEMNKDDFIGTFYINLSQISASGPGDDGFLPSFGPCFINCYGSPREYTVLPDKYDYLNKGLMDGVAYRGRVLVEVEMTLGSFPVAKQVDIQKSDIERIGPLIRCYNYKLFGCFFSASMVQPTDAPIEFEVSIGNYGNKLDFNTEIQSSTTPPSNPSFDGTNYYYLPWLDHKPCIQVDSQWEDVTVRMESLNMILYIISNLTEGLSAVKQLLKREYYDASAINDKIMSILDAFWNNLSEDMPLFPDNGCTRLDKSMYEKRRKEFNCLKSECKQLQTIVKELEKKELILKIEDFVYRLEELAIEPQNSIPDVIIWMLSGNRRVAVKRIPSHEIIFSTKHFARGEHCGKMRTIFLDPPAVEKEEELKKCKAGAKVRIMLWFGLERDQQDWKPHKVGGNFVTFVETYENQSLHVGKWTKPLSRPEWSDASGKNEQPMEAFNQAIPHGWNWDGDWQKSPEFSTVFEADKGLDEWIEEIFEYQIRSCGGTWTSSQSYWADSHGDKKEDAERKITKDDIKCPEEWHWSEDQDWTKDEKRAVDENGWEYAVEDYSMNAWVPYDRNFHTSRRRRWVRLRVRDKKPIIVKKRKLSQQRQEKEKEDFWTYARRPQLSYHLTKHAFDTVRRCRWIRKLVNELPEERAVFRFDDKKKDEKHKKKRKKEKKQVPQIYLKFDKSSTYQLRAYIYQARGMYSSDRSGLSDPYAYVAFGRYSKRSRIIKQSVCPTWDQTLIFYQIKLYGCLKSIQDSPQPVTVELFDKDTFGKDDYLGKVHAIPTIRLSLDIPSPRLDWYKIKRYDHNAGELLAAFELVCDENGEIPFPPFKALPPQTHYIVPVGIRPVLQRTRVEILAWGIRDMKRFQLLQVTSPLLELVCGSTIVRTDPIENANINPNFLKPVYYFDVYLPKECLYAPPLNIHILDKRAFGRTPLVGIHVIKSLKEYISDPVLPNEQRVAHKFALIASTPTPARLGIGSRQLVINMEDAANLDNTEIASEEQADIDWWSKYYYSIVDSRRIQQKYVEQNLDRFIVYHKELEQVDGFNNFTDLTETFPLFQGKGSRDSEEGINRVVGYFKGSIKMYPLPDNAVQEPELMFNNIPTTDPVEVIVRAYIIKGIDLHPQDPGGKSDPYLKVSIGSKVISDRDNYIANELNPIFGRMFELRAKLPLDHTLKITVMDWDRFTTDDLIGETKIDLENRFFTQHRAVCGLPETMSKSGVNRWRDSQTPIDILEDWAESRSFAAPQWNEDGKSVRIGDTRYCIENFEPNGEIPHKYCTDNSQQRLALYILRRQTDLVFEHIETRSLYNPVWPCIPQGQLHMWVDIFKADGFIPDPINISPRKPEKFVLRIVVRNAKEVDLEEVSIMSGEAMSDIYIKGWVRGEDVTQKTDVHYRSLDGEGNFNWRMVFPMEYIPAEKIVVVQKKDHIYSINKTERHLQPIVTLQIWDDDLFNPDDFLGTVDFNLNAMPNPARHSYLCNLEQLDDSRTNDLFKIKRTKGWWPAYKVVDDGVRILTGKMELEFEIVREEEAKLRPAGKGRDDPNMNPTLEKPIRPGTSFLWLTSPMKSCRFIIWRYYKCHIMITIFSILLVLAFIIFICSAPKVFMEWMTSRLFPN